VTLSRQRLIWRSSLQQTIKAEMEGDVGFMGFQEDRATCIDSGRSPNSSARSASLAGGEVADFVPR
jgi:hypothetical protein